MRNHADKNLVIVIAGNKCDLENSRQIKKSDAEEFARKIGAYHIETSAKANVGINEIFKRLIGGTITLYYYHYYYTVYVVFK